MGKTLLSLALALAAAFCAIAAHATTQAWGTALCVGCTTRAQFAAAAEQAAGTQFTLPRTILVVNPDTTRSKWIQVTPPGHQPLATRHGKQPIYAPQGAAISLHENPYADIFIAGDEQTPAFRRQFSRSSTIQWPVSSDEQSVINGVIRFTKNTYVILLPKDTFQSYRTTLGAPLANQIYSSMEAKNPGWANQQLSENIVSALRKLVEKHFGTSYKVCAIWPNGDSACFKPLVVALTGESEISGSAKDANGHRLPDLFTPASLGSSGPGMGIHSSPGSMGYSPVGPSAVWGRGEWLVCGYVGNRLISCYIEQN